MHYASLLFFHIKHIVIRIIFFVTEMLVHIYRVLVVFVD